MESQPAEYKMRRGRRWLMTNKKVREKMDRSIGVFRYIEKERHSNEHRRRGGRLYSKGRKFLNNFSGGLVVPGADTDRKDLWKRGAEVEWGQRAWS
jgi:hypothetical protein